MTNNYDDNVTSYPIAIIGGGLAGCAAAAMLAKSGWRPVILERDTFPRDKLCGEFLSGESQRLLKQIGCLDELLRHNPPMVTHGCFISASGKSLKVTLPAPAYGISRRLLDMTLFRHACSAGAVGIENCEVRSMKTSDKSGRRLVDVVRDVSSSHPIPGQITAALTIGAYGRYARIDYNLDRPFVKKLQPLTGFKLHHRPAPGEAGQAAMAALRETTEVFGFAGGYCGVTLVEGGQVNICMLMRNKGIGEIGSNSWQDIAAYLRSKSKALAARLNTLVPVEGERVMSVSRMTFHLKEQALEDDLLFTGDAAGMIAPLCGDGQAMALESGVILAEMINSRFSDVKELSTAAVAASGLAADWRRVWRSHFATRMRIGRTLHHALLRPSLADAAIAVLRQSPDQVTNYLARATRS